MAVTLGTITTNAWPGAYPYNQTFSAVCDASATALLVFVTCASASVTWTPTATWGSQSMTLLDYKAGSTGIIWVFSLVAPATGTKTFTVSNSSNYGDIGAAAVVPLLGTDTSAPFEAHQATMANNTNAVSVVTASASDLIVGGGFVHYNSGTPACTGDATVTQVYSLTSNANHTAWGYTMPAATAGTWHESFTTTNFNTSTNPTGYAIVAVKPGGGSGPVANTKTVTDGFTIGESFSRFTMKPGFAETFSIAEAFSIGKIKLLALVETWSGFADVLARNTTRSVSDALTLGESLKRAPARTWSEAYTLAESATRRTSRPLSEGYAVSDLLTRAASRGLVDTVTPAETLAKTPNKSVTESFSLSDLFASVKTKVLALSDSATLTEVFTRMTARGLTDGFSLSDLLTSARNRVLALADSFAAFSESLVRSATKTIFDPFTLADALSFLKTKVLALVESLNLSETLLRSTARSFLDTLFLSETFSFGRTRVLALVDALATYADTLSRFTSRSLADPFTLADLLTAIRAKVLALADSLALTDSLVRALNRTALEAFAFTDRLTRTLARTFGETVSLADAIGFVKVKVLTLVDSIVFAEAFLRSTTKSLADGFLLSDLIAFVRSKVLALLDTLVVGDTLARQTARRLIDTLGLTEAFSAARLRSLQLLEAFGLSDSATRATGKYTADSLSLSEALARRTARVLADSLMLLEVFGRGIQKGLAEILVLTESVASLFTPAANLIGQPAHKFVVQLWQRLWAVIAPVRVFSSQETTPFFSAAVEVPLRVFAAVLAGRSFAATELMITTDPKDAEASENFQLDWSAIALSDAIVTSTWEVAAGLTNVSASNTATLAIIRLSGGTPGQRYVVKNLVTLASGQIKTQSLLVPVV